MKVFFSYASEDKAIVEQVFLRVNDKFPNISGWLDKYEIFGGDDLIEKINKGIDSSDKFLIFLSSNSIDKPWIRAELRKALMKEINGVDPEFIIPVKLGKISSFPPFLESKYYIDLETKTENEWLEEIYCGITREPKIEKNSEENLKISFHIAPENPQAAIIVFESMYWAEEVSFIIKTKSKIKSNMWRFPHLKGCHNISINEKSDDFSYGVQILNINIERTKLFYVGLVFENVSDPRKEIIAVEKWDGSGGSSSMRSICFK